MSTPELKEIGSVCQDVRLPAKVASGSCITRLQRWIKSLKKQWTTAQVGHRSMYSVERLHALNDYCHKTSNVRVLAVCVLTPVPALMTMVLYEMIPLQDPNAGWAANYGTWIRYAVLTFMISLGLTFQVKGMSLGISIALWQCITISSLTAACYVGVSLIMGSAWAFPIPFSFVLTLPHFVFFLIFWTFVIVGRQWVTSTTKLSQKLQRYVLVATFPSFIAFAYIVLFAAFSTLPEFGQIATVLLLPFVKLFLKNVMAWVSAPLEEGVAGIVVFSVELAHALFVTTCMQSARSLIASVVIISFDAMHSFASLRTLNRETKTVQRLLHHCKAHWNQQSRQLELVPTVLQICQNPDVLASTAIKFSNFRLRSPLDLKPSPSIRHKIDEMGRYERLVDLARKASQSVSLQNMAGKFSLRSLQIAPLKAPSPKNSPGGIKSEPHIPAQPIADLNIKRVSFIATIEEQVELVRETAQTMFYCEYLVLVEYVECVIPVVYGLYMQMLYRFAGNARMYYPQTRDLTLEKLNSTVGNLVVYVWLEVLSLLLLHIVLRRRFGFSMLRQLAFMLETDAYQVQGRLFVWIPYTVPFTLRHFGTKATFWRSKY